MFTEKNDLVVVEGEPVWWDAKAVAELDRCEKRDAEIKIDKYVKKYLPTLAAIVTVAVYTALVWGVASWQSRVKTEERMAMVYAQELQEYKEEQERAAQAVADPYLEQLNLEAESMARLLYGIKDNDESDLKTYCWCVFNRVDNSSYPSTLEDVIAQPKQWVQYDPANPILEDLYQVAYEQLDEWHSNSHRPCSSEYVFVNWTPNDICLRDNFREGSGTHYWRWGQK